MNKQQAIQKLSYIATSFEDTDQIRSNLFRFIAELTQEGFTDNPTYGTRSFPVDARQEIVLRDHFTCAYCNRVGTIDTDPDGQLWTIDHVIPWSKGGLTCIDNGALCCWRCNNEKGAMTPAQYIRWLRFVGNGPASDPVDDEPEPVEATDQPVIYQVDIEIPPPLWVHFERTRSWDPFCEGFLKVYPDATAADLKRAMAKVDGQGRDPRSFNGEGNRQWNRYSKNGDPEKAKR